MTDKPVLFSKIIRNSTAEFPIFTTQESDSNIEARYENETIWLTQSLIAELLDSTGRTSKAQADEHALSEFDKFHNIQDHYYISAFDRLEQQANMRDRDDSKKQ